MAAVINSEDAFSYASKALQDYYFIIVEMVRRNGLYLQHLPEKWREHEWIVYIAVNQNGLAL